MQNNPNDLSTNFTNIALSNNKIEIANMASNE